MKRKEENRAKSGRAENVEEVCIVYCRCINVFVQFSISSIGTYFHPLCHQNNVVTYSITLDHFIKSSVHNLCV